MTQKSPEFLWCVKVPVNVSSTGELFVHADDYYFGPSDSALVFRLKERSIPVLILAPGSWLAVYLANKRTHWASYCEQWPGESQDSPVEEEA